MLLYYDSNIVFIIKYIKYIITWSTISYNESSDDKSLKSNIFEESAILKIKNRKGRLCL